MPDQLWNPFGPVQVPGTKPPAKKPEKKPTLQESVDRATNPLKYTEKPKGTPENPNQFQLDAQKARGGKSFAETQKAVPGTWENAVERGRKALGITKGSPDDELLKSALWLTRDQTGRVNESEAVKVYRRMGSIKAGNIKERAALSQEIESFRGKGKDSVSVPQSLPFDNWEEALRTQGPVTMTSDFGPYKKGQVIGFTEAGGIVQQFTGKPVEFKPYTEEKQVADAAPSANGFKGQSVYDQNKTLAAAREDIARPATALAKGALNTVNPLGAFGANEPAASLIGGSVADTVFSPLDLGKAVADTTLSGEERVAIGLGALANMIPVLGDLPIKLGIEGGAKLLGFIAKGVESPAAFTGVARLLREAGVEGADGIARNLVREASAGKLDDVAKLGTQVEKQFSGQAEASATPLPEAKFRPVEQALPQETPKVVTQPEIPAVKPDPVAAKMPEPQMPEPKMTASVAPRELPAGPVIQDSGLTHAETARIRSRLDVGDYVKTTRPLGKVLAEAKQVDGIGVARDVLRKTRTVSDSEQAAMITRFHELASQREDLVVKMTDAIKSGDIDGAAKVQALIDTVNEDTRTILEASDRAGSEWGRSGRARQLEIKNSDDPSILQYRYYKATGGKPSAQFDALTNEITTLKKQVAELTDKEAARQAKLADKAIKDPARQRARVNYTRRTSKDDYDRAVRIWQSGGVRKSKKTGAVAVVSQEQWKALKTMARYHLDNGLESAADIANKIIEVVGDTVDKVTIARAVKEAVVDESRVLNTGRTFGEEYMERGANAVESKEIRDLRFRTDRKVAEARQFVDNAEKAADFARASWAKKAGKILTDAIGTTRSILSSGDLSAPGRQGLVMMATRPKAAGRAFSNMFKSITEKGYDRAMWELTQHPRYNEAVSGGLALTDAHGFGPKEEAFISNVLSKVPGVKQWIGASDRTYTAFLNTLRMDAFGTYVDLLEEGGQALTRDDLKGLADWVNMATGRGDLGQFESAGDALAKWFFSPRFMKSRFDLVTARPLRELAKEQTAVTKFVAKEYARSMLVISTTLGLASLAGMTNIDPRSSKFGQIKIGDILVDVTGGMSSPATLLSRIAAWLASWGNKDIAVRKTYDDNADVSRDSALSDPINMILRFGLGKSSPPVRAAYYGIGGKDYKGDPTTLGEQVAGQFVPIGIQNLVQNKDELSPEQTVLAFILDFFGFGTRSEKPKKD